MSAFDFHGQRALVTGGSRGIGAAIARRLAALGAEVILNYVHNAEAAQETADAIAAAGGRATLAQANLAHPESASALAQVAGDRLDMLVHAAAIGSFKPLHQIRANQWDLTLNVNARAFVLCVEAVLPLLRESRGRVVALSSLGGMHVVPRYGAIGISKAALESAVRYLGVELAPAGVRVNAIAAGLVEGTSVQLHPQYDALAEAARRTPLGRLLTVDDVADAVLFLCSPLASGFVGQTLVLDGGATL